MKLYMVVMQARGESRGDTSYMDRCAAGRSVDFTEAG